jgi:hypothetical protein
MFRVHYTILDRWSIAFSVIMFTLSIGVIFFQSAGRNYTTQYKMWEVKESRGHLSVRSSTSHILVANCSIVSPLGITLVMRKSRSSKRRSVYRRSV